MTCQASIWPLTMSANITKDCNMASELVAQGELQRVGQWAFRTGQADFLVHVRHKRLSASGQLFRDWLVAQASE